MKQCRVAGCRAETASQFSPHCRHHKSKLRRQGDTEQTAIRIGELRPFIARVRERIAKNQDNPLWPLLDDVWATIVADARKDAEKAVQNRYNRQAAHMLIGMADDTSARDVVVVTAAMFVLLSERPNRFASDNAFRLQLAKRVLALSYVNTGLRYDHERGKQVRSYREPSPKARTIIGRKLSTAFGALGLQLAYLEKRDRERRDEIANNMRQAMSELV